MSVETRIKAEFRKKRYKPNENGDYTEEVDIPGSGLTIDEVKDHRWVEDPLLMTTGHSMCMCPPILNSESSAPEVKTAYVC